MSNSQFFSNCTADSIREAAAALRAGYLVAFPTETVYGLGADARNSEAVKRVYEVKGRPSDHPLIVHISSINELEKWAKEIPEYAIDLAQAFWPGPMTLILKRTEIAQDFITGGQETVGLRVPSDPIALALIQEFERISGSAIAAPSANRFGQVSPTSSSDVREELSNYLCEFDLILEGGRSNIGIESTIIDCTTGAPQILRPGSISHEDVASISNLTLGSIESLTRVSGNFESHYAPNARIILDIEPMEGQGLIAFDNIPTPLGVIRILSPNTNVDFARGLYSALRYADKIGLKEIVVYQPEDSGIGIAIRDRLGKAAFGPRK